MLSSWVKHCKTRIFICVLEELHQAHPSSSPFWTKSCRTHRSNWPFQLPPIASGGCWAFRSASNILHFFTDLPKHSYFESAGNTNFLWVITAPSVTISTTPISAFSEGCKAPTFQWELSNTFSSLPIYPRICSLPKQPMQASLCLHIPWMECMLYYCSLPAGHMPAAITWWVNMVE